MKKANREKSVCANLKHFPYVRLSEFVIHDGLFLCLCCNSIDMAQVLTGNTLGLRNFIRSVSSP